MVKYLGHDIRRHWWKVRYRRIWQKYKQQFTFVPWQAAHPDAFKRFLKRELENKKQPPLSEHKHNDPRIWYG